MIAPIRATMEHTPIPVFRSCVGNVSFEYIYMITYEPDARNLRIMFITNIVIYNSKLKNRKYQWPFFIFIDKIPELPLTNNIWIGITSNDTNDSDKTNKQYVSFRPHRSRTRWTIKYAINSTTALAAKEIYGFANHAPRRIKIWIFFLFVSNLSSINNQYFVKFHRKRDFVQT